MEKKNKKLIVLIAILTLTIGGSLAYFTSTLLFEGKGSQVVGETTTIDNSTLTVEGKLEFNAVDMYPGHQDISSIKVTATGEAELIPYNVIWEGTNTLATPLNYTVYKSGTQIETEVSCEAKTKVENGAKKYYEECSISNIDSLGEAITSGVINKGETKVKLISDEFITSTPDGTTVYYYVVLEYPNKEENQNIDIGGEFSGKVIIEESNIEPDINIIAAYVIQEDGTYEEVSDIPQEGYTINTEKSVCSNGASVRWENSELITSNLTKSGTSCYLYFDEQTLFGDIILANNPTISTRSSFSSVLTSDTTGTIYQAEDDDGTTYYFAGDTSNNWVQFAGFYWRIIRINGDGSVRLIYNGTSTAETGTSTQLSGTSAFNSTRTDNMYVGFKYTSSSVQGTGTKSTILTALDTWYTSNLAGHEDQIELNAGFCNDRYPSTSSSSSNGSGGTGTTQTYYAAYIRLITNKTPTYECRDSNDLFTDSKATRGNKSLDNPIGLITADEVAYAGSGYGSSFANSTYYLYTNQVYWTLSPFYFLGSPARVFYVNSNGNLDSNAGVNGTYGVRPVINLKASATVSGGNGTASSPYVVT